MQNIQKRIKYHYTGNAEGSTLRKTLGCILANELGIQLRRVGSGNRMTFAEGEQVLSAWMTENAYVSWVVRTRPWKLEDYLIAALNLPLNLRGNSSNRFHPVQERHEPGMRRRPGLSLSSPIPVSAAGDEIAGQATSELASIRPASRR